MDNVRNLLLLTLLFTASGSILVAYSDESTANHENQWQENWMTDNPKECRE